MQSVQGLTDVIDGRLYTHLRWFKSENEAEIFVYLDWRFTSAFRGDIKS